MAHGTVVSNRSALDISCSENIPARSGRYPLSIPSGGAPLALWQKSVFPLPESGIIGG
jgi:hypothetical protein